MSRASSPNLQAGVTSLQVMILISIICVLGGWATTYNRFQDRMNTAKTNAHFLSAINMVKVNHEESLSASQWAGQLNSGALHAMNGGPAFIINNAGNRVTGAIGVAVDDYGAEVHIVRPDYLTLSSIRAVIRNGQVTFNRIRRRRT